MAQEEKLEIVDGATAGGWIEPELSGARGSVTGTVPDRYEAYVRILHPAWLDGGSVTWGQVAEELGRTVHPLAQWDAIVGADRYRNETPDWRGAAPDVGSLEKAVLAPLLETLAEHTTTPGEAFFGIWIGMMWGRFGPGVASETRSTDDLSFAFPAEQVGRPRLHLLGREYVVLAGSIEQGVLVEDRLSPSSPNLAWPSDRAWFLASEIDFDSTLVGGTEAVVRQIDEDGRFEAFRVGPKNRLTWNADKINPSPRSRG
jgi:hypothetical protein